MPPARTAVRTHAQVRSAQSLLAAIAELKQIVLLYDFAGTGAAMQARLAAVRARQQASLEQLAALRPLLDDLLLRCEDASAVAASNP